MQVSRPNKRVIHAAILAILVVGLLFSEGEGIRLLPFPIAAKAACGIEKVSTAADAGYEENVTRFEKRQERWGFKHKPDAGPDEAMTGEVPARATSSTSFRVRSVPIVAVTQTLTTFPSDLNSRPPPVV